MFKSSGCHHVVFIVGQSLYGHTGAALCIAHVFESTHTQSYVIAHKLLICRFDMKFLHKNPVISQI